jgi:hypothetical protein
LVKKGSPSLSREDLTPRNAVRPSGAHHGQHADKALGAGGSICGEPFNAFFNSLLENTPALNWQVISTRDALP